MKKESIDRINYKNFKMDLDFEIVDIQKFYSTRSQKLLEKDYRVNFWNILYIVEGNGEHWIDFRKYSYKKGDMVIIQKNQFHRYLVNQEVKGYLIMINEPFFYNNNFDGNAFLEFVDQSLGSPIIHFNLSKNQTNRKLIDLIYQEYTQNESKINIELISTLLKSFVLSLKGLLPREKIVIKSRNYENFKLYRDLVEKKYMYTRNVKDYANMMHLSKKTINQATRNVVGLSAKEFIVNRVILEIKRYLSQDELLTYEIANILGFSEVANMTKFFKTYEGISPKMFKERLK